MRYELRVLLLLAVFFGLIVLFMPKAEARAILAVTVDGVTITVTDEDCKLKSADLPHRATWRENGRTVEACAGAAFGMAVIYLEGGRIVLLPANVFSRVSES